MVKLKNIKIIIAILALMCCFFGGSNNTYKAYADNDVYLGGFPAGFSVQTKGALVVNLCDVLTENGLKSPSKDAGIQSGDKILYINDIEVNNAKEISSAINNSETAKLTIDRKGERISKTINLAKDLNGEYKLGVFIKDDINGIGTITYIKGDRFASLGHPILDENNQILEITSGNVYSCNIIGVIKGERGKAGELKGVFVKNNETANIEKNVQNGVYGRLSSNFNKENLVKVDLGNAKVGNAYIYSTIDGNCPKKYQCSIVKIDENQSNKNFVIKITDKTLLEKTGGIVQGMSGSPIVQDGKLVGAVTHVFINDPTRGFGISVNNMINN